MAGYVNVRAYAELNDFLGPESRGLTVRRPFRPHQTVKGGGPHWWPDNSPQAPRSSCQSVAQAFRR